MNITHPIRETFHDKLLDGLDFCRLTYSLFDEIAKQPAGYNLLRNRERPEKKLLEELFPIARYVQTFYGPGRYISVRWLDGNQSFDAKIQTSGRLVDHGAWPPSGTLEVTQAVHANEHLMRELLNAKGGGFGLDGLRAGKGKRGARDIESIPVSYTNQSYIGDMAAIILKAIEAKTHKLARGHYPDDTTLIVDCTLNTIFLRDEWERLIKLVRTTLSRTGFVRIFITADSGTYFETL